MPAEVHKKTVLCTQARNAATKSDLVTTEKKWYAFCGLCHLIDPPLWFWWDRIIIHNGHAQVQRLSRCNTSERAKSAKKSERIKANNPFF